MGTQEPSEGLRAERQQTEWTGHWLCICQQSGISQTPPPAAKRVRHHGHSQLSAGLLPFRFPGRPAAGCPKLPSLALESGHSERLRSGATERSEGTEKRSFSGVPWIEGLDEAATRRSRPTEPHELFCIFIPSL